MRPPVWMGARRLSADRRAAYRIRMRTNSISVILALALCVSFAAVAGAADRQPNIIFILADDLGWGDLACYGNKSIKTPHLDRMAKEGVRFTQAYAGST